MRRIRLIIFAVIGIFIAAGLASVWYGVRQVSEAAATAGWPSTQGRIIKADVIRTVEGGERMFSDEIAHYSLVFEYQYSVGGRPYTGARIAVGETPPDGPAAARSRIAPYPLNAAVTVYYSPDDPQQSCLAAGTTSASWPWIAGGIVTVFFSVRLLQGWMKEFRSSPDPTDT